MFTWKMAIKTERERERERLYRFVWLHVVEMEYCQLEIFLHLINCMYLHLYKQNRIYRKIKAVICQCPFVSVTSRVHLLWSAEQLRGCCMSVCVSICMQLWRRTLLCGRKWNVARPSARTAALEPRFPCSWTTAACGIRQCIGSDWSHTSALAPSTSKSTCVFFYTVPVCCDELSCMFIFLLQCCLSLHHQRWSLMPDQPTSTYGNYPGTASNPIRAYWPYGRQCRRKADLDFLAFCILERPPGRPRMTWMKAVQNDLNSHGLSWTEAVDLVQNRSLWRLLVTSGAMHLYWCKPEMMMVMSVAFRTV